jgi:hypothetical protein
MTPCRALRGATTTSDAGPRIISDPPLIAPVDSASLRDELERVIGSYRATL